MVTCASYTLSLSRQLSQKEETMQPSTWSQVGMHGHMHFHTLSLSWQLSQEEETAQTNT